MKEIIIIDKNKDLDYSIFISYFNSSEYLIKIDSSFDKYKDKVKDIFLIICNADKYDKNTLNNIYKIQEKREHPKILIILNSTLEKDIIPYINAGVNGIITKTFTNGELTDTIRNITNNKPYISPQIISHKLTKLIKKKHHLEQLKYPQLLNLTKREIEILKLIGDELTNTEIAEKLFVSPRTIDTHRRNLLLKIGAKNTVGLVKFAFRTKLIE